MPTIHTITALKRPSTLQTPRSARKPPKVQVHQNNQLADFREKDKIINFVDITQSQTPANYLFRKTSEYVVLLSLVFCATKGFPKIFGATKIDKDLNVQLGRCGDPVPLPQAFVRYFNYDVQVFAVLFWSKSAVLYLSRKLSPGSMCVYTVNSVLYDFIRYLAFSIKFITFCHCKIKMQFKNDFWDCIKSGLLNLINKCCIALKSEDAIVIHVILTTLSRY